MTILETMLALVVVAILVLVVYVALIFVRAWWQGPRGGPSDG